MTINNKKKKMCVFTICALSHKGVHRADKNMGKVRRTVMVACADAGVQLSSAVTLTFSVLLIYCSLTK